MKNKILKRAIATLGVTAALISSVTGCGSTASVSDTDKSADSDVTTVRVATTGSPAPYMVVDENSEIGGSDIEILKAIFDKHPQYKLDIIKTDDPLTGLTSDLYDLAVNNYAWRDERGELYYYSLPYKTGYDVYIQRKDDKPLTGLQDLADRGYKTEVSAGSNKALALEHWNEENPDHQINIVYSDSDFQVKFQNIVDGKTDVAIDDGPILDTLVGEFGLENDLAGNTIDADTQEFISPHNSSYFLFQKNEKGDALRKDVDEALLEIKEDGTLAEILTNYFGKDTSPADEDLKATPN